MKGAFPCSAVLCGALLCLFLETSFSLNILVVKCCRRLPPSLRFLSLLLCICWERTMLYKYNQRHFKVVVPTRTTTSLRFRMVRQRSISSSINVVISLRKNESVVTWITRNAGLTQNGRAFRGKSTPWLRKQQHGRAL